MRFGIVYLRQVEFSAKENAAKQQSQPHVQSTVIHRHVISQCEWKVTFSAIAIHLQKWDPLVQVFACDSFLRGAAFGSTIDILVVASDTSIDPSNSTNTVSPIARLQHEEVIGALRSPKIVHKRAPKSLCGTIQERIADPGPKDLRAAEELVRTRVLHWTAELCIRFLLGAAADATARALRGVFRSDLHESGRSAGLGDDHSSGVREGRVSARRTRVLAAVVPHVK